MPNANISIETNSIVNHTEEHQNHMAVDHKRHDLGEQL